MAEVADLRRQRGPHVFVVDLDNPVIAEDDRHHLSRSLRVRSGDPITISDGRGRWRTAVFGDVVGGAVGELGPVIETGGAAGVEPVVMSLAIALTKAGKPEMVVQKATELGMDRVVVFHGERSVPRWEQHKRERAGQRLARVAREAAMQSRRTDIPAVLVVDSLAEAIEVCGSQGFVRADIARSGKIVGMETSSVRTIAVGPEGGWSQAEHQLVESVWDFGTNVLRAETAAIVSAARLASVRSDGGYLGGEQRRSGD